MSMDLKAFDTVRQLAASHYLVSALHVVAELGVADQIGDRPSPISDVAAKVGANADALGRALRLLSSRGIFEVKDDMVGHSSASRFLRSDDPASLLPLVRMFAQPVQWQAASQLRQSIETGEAAISLADGGLWGYFSRNPTEARVFDAAMAAKSTVQVADLLAAFDFSRFRRVVDIGGGQGHFLRALLERHRDATGVLFDVPGVIEAVRSVGVPERMQATGGDFFTSDLPIGDAVVLMEVLHDWNDDDCARLLQRIAKAAAPDTTLIVVEIEMAPGNSPDWPKLLDIVMLGIFGARQRTNAEYADLLARNGFEVISQTSTPGELTVFEAVPSST